MSKKTFVAFTAGDFGDVIHCMAVLKAVAEKTGPVKMVYANRGECKGIEERIDVIKPLIEAQPYIAEVEKWEGCPVHWQSNGFRFSTYSRTKSLAQAHLDHYLTIQGLPSIKPDFRQPWIIDPDQLGPQYDTIIINRSSRYPNYLFPWREIVNKFGARIKFIGLQSEHDAFCAEFGNVGYFPTPTLLDAADTIAGSSLFIGNQSSCFALAEGMKHPRILEVCPTKPDVIVAAEQPNCQYSCDGALTIDGTIFPSQALKTTDIPRYEIPPRGWRYPHPDEPENRNIHIKGVSFPQVKHLIAQTYGVDLDTAEKMLCDFAYHDNPGFWASDSADAVTLTFREALANSVQP